MLKKVVTVLLLVYVLAVFVLVFYTVLRLMTN